MANVSQNEELQLYLKSLFNEDYEKFINAQIKKTAIRVNTLKLSVDAFVDKLHSWNQPFTDSPFPSNGFIINNDQLPLSHTLDYFLGNIFYQGISSQLPVEILNVKPGDVVLDMAAAPGSKSCQILNKLNHQGYLIINDCSYKRMQALNVNVQRTGACNYFILNTWGEECGTKFFEYFDKVLLDAPCTALGTLVASEEVAQWWSRSKLSKLAKSQFSLLVSGLKALKVGGELVYSTCSVAPEENENVIQKIIENYPVEIVNINHRFNNCFSTGLSHYHDYDYFDSLKKAIRVYPHLHGFEGFFVVKLKKTGQIKNKRVVRPFSTKALLTYNDTKVKIILDQISEKWGIDKSIWANYYYNLTKNRIWMSGNVKEVPLEKFVCTGILLSEKKLSGWKLFNNSAIFLGSKITKRKIGLEDNLLIHLFKSGKINISGYKNGYYVLERKRNIIASVYIENNTMFLRLPHSFNLVLD